jgi:hypothetical protein
VRAGYDRKVTPGVTEPWRVRVPIGPAACFPDVDTAHPGGAAAPKGRDARPLKGNVSWVQNVASQFGFYLLGLHGRLRGRDPKYERNGVPGPLVYRSSSRASPGSHAPTGKG